MKNRIEFKNWRTNKLTRFNQELNQKLNQKLKQELKQGSKQDLRKQESF